MSVAAEKIKIMSVETSTAMLDVLRNFSKKHGYEADNFSDPTLACTALAKNVEQSESDYLCILLGWPEGSPAIIDDLLEFLTSTDQQDLPLLIICQEISNEIEQVVRHRAGTHTLLWKDYEASADIIDGLALVAIDDHSEKFIEQKVDSQGQPEVVMQAALETTDSSAITTKNTVTPIKTLLLDNAPLMSRTLRDMMEDHGYQVTVASSVAEARMAIEEREYDLVVTDFFLRGEGGEEFCRYLQSAENLPGAKPVCVVVSSKHSDAIVKRSLAAGAISCLYKNESTELLFARIDALARALPMSASTPITDDTLTEMLESANDPAVLVDYDGLIVQLNSKASLLLDDLGRQGLVGSNFSSAVHSSPIVLEVPKTAEFLTSSGGHIAVSYMAQHVALKGDDRGILLTFTRQSVHVTKEKLTSAIIMSELLVEPEEVISENKAVVDLDDTLLMSTDYAEAEVEAEAETETGGDTIAQGVNPQAISADKETGVISVAEGKVYKSQAQLVDHFNESLALAIATGASGPRHSVLMLDIELIAGTGDRLSLGHSEPMLEIVTAALGKLYTRENSFAYLGNGQFGFVLANRRKQDALVLTKKLLRVVPQLVKYLNNMMLVSHGALLQLSEDSPQDVDEVLSKVRRACERARQDNRDNAALVMPMKKYLSAKSPKEGASDQAQVIAE